MTSPKYRAAPAPIYSDSMMDDLVSLLVDLHRGCDVWARPVAGVCRWLSERGLVEITQAQTRPAGHEQQPYFGAILTERGREMLALLQGRA